MILAYDTETALIRPGQHAPPLACLSWATDDGKSGLLDRFQARAAFETWLDIPEIIFTGLHIAYDMAVMCAEYPHLTRKVFAAYRADRVTDVGIRQKLLDIAAGQYRGKLGDGNVWMPFEYGLEPLARRAGIFIKKDGFRLHYGEFRDVPLERWVEHAPTVQAAHVPRLLELRAMATAQGKHFELKEELRDLEGLIAANPKEVVTYPIEDATAPLAIFNLQEEHSEYLKDQYRKARTGFWQYLMSTWGLRTDPSKVAKLTRETEEDLVEIEERLIASGLVRGDGTRDTKKAKARMVQVCGWVPAPEGQFFQLVDERRNRDGSISRTTRGRMPYLPAAGEIQEIEPGLFRWKIRDPRTKDLRLTKTDGVSLDALACKLTEDSILQDYADRASLKAVLDKDVVALLLGAKWPIHSRFDIAETGRSTSSKPNVQNWRTGRQRRDKEHTEIRECFVPRPGKVFVQADYTGLELRTLAQACLWLVGKSRLAEILNAGRDPHLEIAATILKISYEEAERRLAAVEAGAEDKPLYLARQTAKVANFGFPGGLGAARLCYFAKKTYKVDLTEDQARGLKKTWLAALPEMRDYFDLVSSQVGDGGEGVILQCRAERYRGGVTYTAACNSYFQGLGADATQEAGFLVSEACYAIPTSPLYHARIVNYVHDEFILEADDNARAHDAAQELVRLMLEGANKWLPDVPAKTKPLLMRFWSKDAQPIVDKETGRLVPWPQERKAA